MLLLSTYIDGERWASAFEPLLCPAGLSFYRSFSYSGSYFEPNALVAGLTSSSSEQISTRRAFFGVRFRKESGEPFVRLFIPLREVSLTAVRQAQQLNLYFKLGAYVVPRVENGKPSLPRVDLSSLPSVTEVKLCIERPDAECKGWQLSNDFPDNFWRAFEDTLSPLAWERVLGAITLRLDRIRKRGSEETLRASQLDSTQWGYELHQDSVYDLFLMHDRIRRPDTQVLPVEHLFRLENSSDEVSSSRRLVYIRGNYRETELWISPVESTQAPITVSWKAAQVSKPDVTVEAEQSKTIGFEVPVSVNPKTWSRNRVVNLLWFLGATAIAVTLAVLLVRSGALGWTSNDDVAKIMMGVLLAASSVAIASLKDVLAGKN